MELTLSDRGLRTGIRDYFTLMKPRVMSLAIFTGMAGMLLAPAKPAPITMLAALISLALGGGAAGAFNMWLERDMDARMERTRQRPVATGRISPHNAFRFASLCTIISSGIMAMDVNLLAAALLLSAILFYVFVYTLWLKPRTPMSIVIGGAAGALPPVIGWAAATDNISLLPLVLFMITFLWTPPHFWALALVREKDYRQAGIPVLPLVSGRKATIRQMLLYVLALVPVTLWPFILGTSGQAYSLGAILLNAGFIFQVLRLRWKKDDHSAISMFLYSLFYLTGIFALLIVDHIFYA